MIIEITKQDQETMRIINSFTDRMTSIFREAHQDPSKDNAGISDLLYRDKYKGDNKGQYGYYISPNVGCLYLLMKKLKLRSILDLGAGAGIALMSLRCYDENIVAYGYEIEPKLVEYAVSMFPSVEVEKQDIITITEDDVKDFDCIYFYEPFIDRALARKFVNNLERVLRKGQIIIYKYQGVSSVYMKEVSRFQLQTVNLKYPDESFTTDLPLGFKVYKVL